MVGKAPPQAMEGWSEGAPANEGRDERMMRCQVRLCKLPLSWHPPLAISVLQFNEQVKAHTRQISKPLPVGTRPE
jgi:hypothetical protein